MKKLNVILWAVLIIILTIKYANAQETKWDNAHPNPAKSYIENKEQEKKFNEFKKSIRLTPVKMYDLPEIVKETNTYTVENYNDRIYKITRKANGYDFLIARRYNIDFQDYQDIIEIFQELLEAQPNPKNYDYEVEGERWYIKIHKTDNEVYHGEIGEIFKGKRNRRDILFTDDVLFLASLPIDIWE